MPEGSHFGTPFQEGSTAALSFLPLERGAKTGPILDPGSVVFWVPKREGFPSLTNIKRSHIDLRRGAKSSISSQNSKNGQIEHFVGGFVGRSVEHFVGAFVGDFGKFRRGCQPLRNPASQPASHRLAGHAGASQPCSKHQPPSQPGSQPRRTKPVSHAAASSRPASQPASKLFRESQEPAKEEPVSSSSITAAFSLISKSCIYEIDFFEFGGRTVLFDVLVTSVFFMAWPKHAHIMIQRWPPEPNFLRLDVLGRLFRPAFQLLPA